MLRQTVLHAAVATARRANAARVLSFAAAPTFAVMALVTGTGDAGMPAMLCSSARGASPLTGMAAMYVLMSAFHLAPWLRLISGRRGGAWRWSPMSRRA